MSFERNVREPVDVPEPLKGDLSGKKTRISAGIAEVTVPKVQFDGGPESPETGGTLYISSFDMSCFNCTCTVYINCCS